MSLKRWLFLAVPPVLTLVLQAAAQAAPFVAISAPSPATGTVTVTAKARHRNLVRLEIYRDGNLLASCPASPCIYSWDTTTTTDGYHTLLAQRHGRNGGVTESAPLQVIVSNDSTNSDSTPPSVSLTVPSTASGVVTISASASDANGVTSTELHVDGARVMSSPSGSASYDWDTTTATNGSHTVRATAKDQSGNVGLSAAGVSVNNASTPPPPPPPSSGGGIAELPREYVDTTYVPPTGKIITVPAGGDFQAALNAAQPGDLIQLQAGVTYSGPFTLPNKPGAGWITIQSSAMATLPPSGTRVSPSHAAFMPKIVGTGSPVIAIQTATGAHHFRFIGVEIAPAAGLFATSLIRLGSSDETVAANQPHHLIFDRVYLHGDPVVGSRRGIMLNSAHTAVLDSHVSDFKEEGGDSQALAGWNGPGPFRIVNNHLEGAGENVMFGGADPKIPNLVPADIEIRHNHFTKPLSWMIGHPTYAGTPWTVKNLFELKNARRVLVTGNLFEYGWEHAQDFAINLKSTNQEGTAPWSVTEDVTFEHNVIRHVAGGVKVSPTHRIVIRNNLWEDISQAWGSRGWFALVIASIDGLEFDQNTAVPDMAALWLEGGPNPGLVVTNNALGLGGYGIKGSGVGEGNPTLNTNAPGAVVTGNAWISDPRPNYPTGNVFVPSLAHAPAGTGVDWSALRQANPYAP